MEAKARPQQLFIELLSYTRAKITYTYFLKFICCFSSLKIRLVSVKSFLFSPPLDGVMIVPAQHIKNNGK
jgi:hypothetical protein